MGSIYKRGRIYWIKYYRDGRAMRESSESTKESDAKTLLAKREGAIANGLRITPKSLRITIDELLNDVIDDYRANRRRSIDDLECRIRKHLLPFFGKRRAASISTSDARRFIVERQEEGASNGEINRELSNLKRAFSLGIESQKVLHRPHIPLLQEKNVRVGFFEHDQFETIMKHVPDHVRPVIHFAYITGWRTLSEILPLQWRQVDFAASEVRRDPGTTKNNEGRVFPMTSELRTLLEEQRKKTDQWQRETGTINPWVFTYKGKPFKSYKRSWATACRKAGLPGMIPHDFRRTAVRNLVRAGIPERVAMQMTGHKTRSVFERYNIVSVSDLKAALHKLDAMAGVGKAEVSD
jgi:integrase